MRLKDKVAIVIGGGQAKSTGKEIGNGRAICLRFAREGAKVIVVARHLESAQETVSLLKAEGLEACAFACDSTDRNQVENVFTKCNEVYGGIDILIHCVGGVPAGDSGLFTCDADSFDRGMNLNLKSALNCIQASRACFFEGKGGAIVLISSTASVQVHSYQEPIIYNLSKCALNRLGETAAAQVAADGIRVNNIVLGYMNTPRTMRNVHSEEDKQKLLEERNKKVLLRGGMGDAWDTANAALFLASEEARFITGTTLFVDGGFSLIRGL